MGNAFAALLLGTALSLSTVAGWSPPRAISHSAWPARLQYNFGWAIDVDDAGVVHAAWLELVSPEPAGYGTGRVMYARSPDDGRNWTPPAPLSGEPLPITGHPRVAAAGASVYVAWHGPHPSGVLKAYLLQSHDHGSTWQGPIVVSEHWSAAFPTVNACGNAVHVVWGDSRTGVPEIYLRSSPDAGASWTPVREVSSPDGRSSWVPVVACSGSDIHVAWSDERHNVDGAGQPYDCGIAGDASTCREEEYYRRSTDFGETWEAEVRLTHDAMEPQPSWAPSIAVVGDTVHVAFFDGRSGRFAIYYMRSMDGGAAGSWETERVISGDDGMSQQARPVLAVRGAEVHLTWFSVTPSVGVNVLHAASPDGGTSFMQPRRLTKKPSMGEAHPSIAVSPRGSAHVIWYQAGRGGVDQIVHRAWRH